MKNFFKNLSFDKMLVFFSGVVVVLQTLKNLRSGGVVLVPQPVQNVKTEVVEND